MVNSCCASYVTNLCDDTHGAAFNFLNRPDLLNVSITRARVLQHIYYSFEPDKLNSQSLFGRFFQHHLNLQTLKKDDVPVHDKYLKEVIEELKAKDFSYWVSYQVAGEEIDLILKYNDQIFGVDLIGYPGQFSSAFSLERYKIFNRAGLKIFSLPYTYWVIDKEKCFGELIKWVKGH